jgi:hypothetical protein
MSGQPIVICKDRKAVQLRVVPLRGEMSTYDEAFIQKLAFENPDCLPITEIDRAFENPVPICMELNTPAGPLDALYITPTGRIVLLEAKLWRNPEARRKVVAQILDYAKELSSWDYEDLQREVSKSLKRKGNVPYQIVSAACPNIQEAQFVDDVQECLKKGRFLLLILGDGIRKGAGAITNFLTTVGSLEFTFGLVELRLFEHEEIGLLVHPQVLARTVEIQRVIVELPEEARIVEVVEEREADSKLEQRREFYTNFWTEFINGLQLDDAAQPLANPTKTENVFFVLPPSGQIAWVSAYFARTSNTVGVYLRLSQNLGAELYDRLLLEQEDIEREIDIELSWRVKSETLQSISHVKQFPDVWSPKYREEIKSFFAETVNAFINTFRPRLERYVEELDS